MTARKSTTANATIAEFGGAHRTFRLPGPPLVRPGAGRFDSNGSWPAPANPRSRRHRPAHRQYQPCAVRVGRGVVAEQTSAPWTRRPTQKSRDCCRSRRRNPTTAEDAGSTRASNNTRVAAPGAANRRSDNSIRPSSASCGRIFLSRLKANQRLVRQRATAARFGAQRRGRVGSARLVSIGSGGGKQWSAGSAVAGPADERVVRVAGRLSAAHVPAAHAVRRRGTSSSSTSARMVSADTAASEVLQRVQ